VDPVVDRHVHLLHPLGQVVEVKHLAVERRLALRPVTHHSLEGPVRRVDRHLKPVHRGLDLAARQHHQVLVAVGGQGRAVEVGDVERHLGQGAHVPRPPNHVVLARLVRDVHVLAVADDRAAHAVDVGDELEQVGLHAPDFLVLDLGDRRAVVGQDHRGGPVDGVQAVDVGVEDGVAVLEGLFGGGERVGAQGREGHEGREDDKGP